VAAVVTGGPAEAAGLRVGDIITSIAGQAATSTDQLVAITLTKRAGDRVEIGYIRDGTKATTTITLGARS
jgi:putative serine protease PepD